MAVNRSVKVAVALETGAAKTQLEGLRKQTEALGKQTTAASKSVSDSAKIAKEAISSTSSELIESLGVDGDIANVFGAQIAGLRASTLLLGGTVAGVVAAIGGLVAVTLKIGSASRELELSSDALGLGIEKLQIYAQASEAAGVSADTLSGVFSKFREQTGGNEKAFDGFLRSLESVQSPTERLSIAQGRLGELSDDARRAILALTEQNGELRRSIVESGIVLSEIEAREMAQIDKRFDQLLIKAKGLGQRGILYLIDNFAEMGVVMGEGTDGLDRLAAAHARAEQAARNQVGAVNQLRDALDNANEAGLRSAVGKRVDDIVKGVSSGAPRALTPAEARAVVANRQKQDGDFRDAIAQTQIFAKNRKLIEDIINPSSGSGGGRGRGGAKKQTEADQLASQLTGLNKEIAILGNQSSKEFQLRVDIEQARKARNELEEIFKLQVELGVNNENFSRLVRGTNRKITNFDALREQADLSRGPRTLPAGFDQLNESRLATLKVEKETIEQGADVLKEQLKIAELLEETTANLQDQLADLKNGGTGKSKELSTRRALRNAGISDEDGKGQINLAKQVDAQEAYQKAVEESQRRTEEFKSTVESLFESLLDSPKRFFDQLKGLVKSFAASTLTKVLFGGGSGGGGGIGALASGGGGSTGGGSGGGGILGGFLNGGLFRTPGINPAAGGGGTGGGGGILSGLLSGGKSGLLNSTLGKGITAVGGKLAGLLGIGGGGLGGGISVGVGGGAAGAGAGGGLGLASLGALLTNPITGIVAGAAIGGFLLYRYFRGRDLRKLRDLVKSQYGVDIKDNGTLKSIREIGKANFGKEYDRRLNETVGLPAVRELVANYAENTGQAGNGSLVSKARLGDKFDNVNLVRRRYGGPVSAGQTYLVGENAPELFRPRQSGTVVPNAGGMNAEMFGAMLGMMEMMNATLKQWTPKSPNDVLMAADSRTHAAVVKAGFDADNGLYNKVGYQVSR